MSNRIEAIFDSSYTLGGKSTTIILGENLKYIIALLNSKLSDFAINILYNSLKMSGVYLNIGTRELENFPIPAATKSQQQPIITLVDQILEAKKTDPSADTSAIESKIDQLVYQLYSLTNGEIKIVEGK